MITTTRKKKLAARQSCLSLHFRSGRGRSFPAPPLPNPLDTPSLPPSSTRHSWLVARRQQQTRLRTQQTRGTSVQPRSHSSPAMYLWTYRDVLGAAGVVFYFWSFISLLKSRSRALKRRLPSLRERERDKNSLSRVSTGKSSVVRKGDNLFFFFRNIERVPGRDTRERKKK